MIDKLKKFELYYKDGLVENRGIYMSEMEKEFKIPFLNNEKYNEKHKEVINLYQKFAAWPLED